jgi:hypothetical protein
MEVLAAPHSFSQRTTILNKRCVRKREKEKEKLGKHNFTKNTKERGRIEIWGEESEGVRSS